MNGLTQAGPLAIKFCEVAFREFSDHKALGLSIYVSLQTFLHLLAHSSPCVLHWFSAPSSSHQSSRIHRVLRHPVFKSQPRAVTSPRSPARSFTAQPEPEPKQEEAGGMVVGFSLQTEEEAAFAGGAALGKLRPVNMVGKDYDGTPTPRAGGRPRGTC